MGKVGRPTKLSEKMTEAICTRIMSGESLNSICKDPDMPSRPTVFKWIHENTLFSNKYAQARTIQAECLIDEIIDVADGSEPEHAGKTRIQVDTRKWYASKVLPKVYGDRLDVTSGGEKISMPAIVVSDKDEAADMKAALGL